MKMTQYKRLEACADDCAAVTKLKAESCKYELDFQRIDKIGNSAIAAVTGGFTPAYVYLAIDGFSNGELVKGITCSAMSVIMPIFTYLFGKRAWKHKKKIDEIKQIKQGLESKLN